MEESIRAVSSPGYRWRPGVFALASLFMGAWFCYDGFYAWPRENEIAVTFKQFENRRGEWQEYARSRGWPDNVDNPGKEHSNTDIFWNRGLCIPLFVVGGLYLVAYFRTFGRWIASDGQTLTTSGGLRVPFDAISAINLDRWRTKGIAVVNYTTDNKPGKLVLDDWKYDQQATMRIVDQIKAHLGLDVPAN